MKVQRGNAKPKRMTKEEAEVEMYLFLRNECGIRLDHVRFNKHGEIQLKTLTGLKIVILPKENKIIFC